ncbi:UNVERIFIED_CONTAM: hypothetical protein HDU68_005401, partial [Siphonaria sp. JEL0065]
MVAGFAASERMRSLSRGGGLRSRVSSGGGFVGVGVPQLRVYERREVEAAVLIQRWLREQFEVKRRRRVLREREAVRRKREEEEQAAWVVDDEQEDDDSVLIVDTGRGGKEPYSVLNVLERVNPDFGNEVVRKLEEKRRDGRPEDVRGPVAVAEEAIAEWEKSVEVLPVVGVEEVNDKENSVPMDVDAHSPYPDVVYDQEESAAGRYSETFEDASSILGSISQRQSTRTTPLDRVQETNEEPRSSHGPVAQTLPHRSPFGDSQLHNISGAAEIVDMDRRGPSSVSQKRKGKKRVVVDPDSVSSSFNETSDVYLDSNQEYDNESTDTETNWYRKHQRHSSPKRRGSAEMDLRRQELYGLSPRSLQRKMENELKHLDVIEQATAQISELQRTHLLTTSDQDQTGLQHLLREAKSAQHQKDLELARQDRELKQLRAQNLPTEAVAGFGYAAPAAGPWSYVSSSTAVKQHQHQPQHDYAREDFDIVSEFANANKHASAPLSVAPGMEVMDVYSSSADIPSAISSFGVKDVESHSISISENLSPKTPTTDTVTTTTKSTVTKSSYSEPSNISMFTEEDSINLEALLDRENVRVPETDEDYLAALDARYKLSEEYAKRELKTEKERLHRLTGGSEADKRERYEGFKKMVLMKFAIEKADIERTKKLYLDSVASKKRQLTDSTQSLRDKSFRVAGQAYVDPKPVSATLQPSKKQSQKSRQQVPVVSSSSVSSIPEEVVFDDKATGASYTSIAEEAEMAQRAET